MQEYSQSQADSAAGSLAGLKKRQQSRDGAWHRVSVGGWGGLRLLGQGRTIAADLCSAVVSKASHQRMDSVNLDMPHARPLLRAAALIYTILKVTTALRTLRPPVLRNRRGFSEES